MYSCLVKKSIKTFFQLAAILLFSVAITGCGATNDAETGANPGVEDFPIAYAKRSILLDNNDEFVQPDLRRPLRSMPGGDVYLKARSTIAAPETRITSRITTGDCDDGLLNEGCIVFDTNGQLDVKDLSVSYDGKLLLFSALFDADPEDNVDPKWDIYIYDRTRNLPPNRVIKSDIVAIEGDDIAPHFLPDGRIVFSSNRQSQSRAILLNEALAKPQFSSVDENFRTKALVLHVMNADGSSIQQISFNQSHDLDPTVMSDGRILFSRWDRLASSNAISLYTILPDGSDLQPYYGLHDQSHEDEDGNTVQIVQPHELADGRIMALQQPYDDTFGGGDIVIIDGKNFIDLNQPVAANQGVINGLAIEKATVTQVVNDGGRSIEGRYSSVYPLKDGSDRMLVSKGLCQVSINISANPEEPELVTRPCIEPYISDDSAVAAYPAYGVWLYNRNDDTEKPIVLAEQTKMIADAVAMRPVTRPDINLGEAAENLDDRLKEKNVGLLKIRSVYDFGDDSFNGCFFFLCSDADVDNVLAMGDPALVSADQRPARFLRIVKAVGIPDRRDPDLADPPNLSNNAFGRARFLGMREIIGYVPIKPDGSVNVEVPANIAFYIEVLDKAARRIGPRHENWLQVNAGGTLTCSGCHRHLGGEDAPLPLPHGRTDAEPVSMNLGAPSDGFLYPNTENPATIGEAYFANAGDTMADALQRSQEVNNVFSSITPSVNVEYTDVWTDESVRPKDAAFSYVYSGLEGLLTPIPTTAECEEQWSATCRIVINYLEHIQPIWEVDRPTGNCTSCHASKNSEGADMLPAGQLDLTGGVSDDEPQHVTSYRELFFEDNFQVLDNGVLTDLRITVAAVDDNGDPILDADGNPTFEDIPDPDRVISPIMNAVGGARRSFFMEKMVGEELNAGRSLIEIDFVNVPHDNMLTPAELRLIAEWLDLGGRYFNNPFDPAAPEN